MDGVVTITVRPGQWLGANLDLAADMQGRKVIVRLAYSAARQLELRSIYRAGSRLIRSSQSAIDAASAAATRAFTRRNIDSAGRIVVDQQDLFPHSIPERLLSTG